MGLALGSLRHESRDGKASVVWTVDCRVVLVSYQRAA